MRAEQSQHHGDEKSYVRVAALLVVLFLVTVLLYQVIDDVQRQAAQRRRELRRQQWREERDRREREYELMLQDVLTTQPSTDTVRSPDSAADKPVPTPRSE
jgi:predicted Holliday junction resolvase-like endonuclease